MVCELLTVGQMAQADAATIQAGTPGFTLMQAAGDAVVRAITQRWSARDTVVLCGPGNNGGDGFIVAARLRELGWPVRVACLGGADALKGDAALAAQAWLQGSEGAADIGALQPACLDGAQLIVDALFGAGLTRPLDGAAADVLMRASGKALPIVAVDVPSGVWGDTGEASGAVPCQLTVTFFRLKPAHALMPGRALCGEVVLADIGIEPTVLPALKVQTYDNQPAVWRDVWPHMDAAGHKYHRGHALIWGGPEMTGAARLAARSCARIGSGLTTVCTPRRAWPVYAAALECIMVHPLDGEAAASWQMGLEGLLDDDRLSAMLMGPGAMGGTNAAGIRGVVLTMLASGRPVVLDADAISAFHEDPSLLFAAIKGHSRPVVLTPHGGEFVRLFKAPEVSVASSKLDKTRAAARLSGAVVLFKGADTVIAAPDGRAAINRHAPSTLATAGAGDVLAGMIVGLLAQGMPAWQAACAASWLHGDAAQHFGLGLIADDLPDLIPAALQRLAASH
ncbi:MAG: NAD(P)H-hydrate dehydratase [Aquabacterium sp.]|uniref:NAD(P)H-hydrate dehydratase n=1 Tax=Aquabacterium sp. TaxID=1872578 RepID=UPI0025C57B9F|nr:NAD(P)H-hydrate dehydratase [Aquabacterium sp.]MBI5926301.1 NAD(P)H-hydrate dehydratase [Aquabacterium sp.]